MDWEKLAQIQDWVRGELDCCVNFSATPDPIFAGLPAESACKGST